MSGMLPTSRSPFLLSPPCPTAACPPALPVLTAPALAPLVPPDEGVAKKHQDQQGQPDTQDNPERIDGLLPWKAEGEGALQTNASGRLGVLIIPGGGTGLLRGWDRPPALCCPYSTGGPRSTRLLSVVARRVLRPQSPVLEPCDLGRTAATSAVPRRAGKGAQRGAWATRCPQPKRGTAVNRSPCQQDPLLFPLLALPGAHPHPRQLLAVPEAHHIVLGARSWPPRHRLHPHSQSHAHSSGVKHPSALHRELLAISRA